MSGARSGKPLFELLREQPGGAGEAGAPGAETQPPRARVIRVPLSTAYIGIALLAGLLLLAWVGGHAVGYAAGQNELARAATPEALGDLVIRDPIGQRQAGPPGAGLDEPPGEPNGPAPEAGVGSVSDTPLVVIEPIEEGDIITATGLAREDPREPLVNYLVLATLSEGKAGEAVQFLATRGIEAIAVPSRPGSNLYRVISLELAVPSGAYRESAHDRHRHEAEVQELGREWLRDFGGVSDFSSTMWALHEP